jgi:subtilisin family serine protease
MSVTQLQQIHADVLHNKGYHGEGITIALLDTGFDLSHEALRNVHVLAEYDFVNGDGETADKPPEDDIGQDDHGTEVLSIIASISSGNLIGVAYASQYLLAKTEKISHKGAMFEHEIEEDWWVAGLEWAELNGADVVSSSLGYSDWYSYSNMDGATAKTTIAADMAVQKGIAVVVSAGNEGKSQDWPYISAPADGFHVIAVGAVNSTGELADFSSTGPTYDGRIKPDVVAMGDDTYVVDPNSTDGYRKADGTSMATPLVAGTAALLLQALPDLRGPRELATLLKYTATHALSPDNRWGWGIINAEAALRYGESPHLMEELDDWDPTGAVSHPSRVIVYPNPVRRSSSTGRLNIHSPEPIDSIEIYDISGVLIYEMQDMGSTRFSIWNLKNEYGQEVASGIYICVIKSSAGSIDVKKIAVID